MIHWIFTISRIIAVPFCWKLIQVSNPIAIYIFVYAVFSDFLDGFFARLLNKITIIGAIADVAADKLLIYSTIFAIYRITTTRSLVYLAILWIIRDFSLIYLWRNSNVNFQSMVIGKIYTFFQFFIVFVLLIAHIKKFQIPSNAVNAVILLFLFLAIWTIKIYGRQFK